MKRATSSVVLTIICVTCSHFNVQAADQQRTLYPGLDPQTFYRSTGPLPIPQQMPSAPMGYPQQTLYQYPESHFHQPQAPFWNQPVASQAASAPAVFTERPKEHRRQRSGSEGTFSELELGTTTDSRLRPETITPPQLLESFAVVKKEKAALVATVNAFLQQVRDDEDALKKQWYELQQHQTPETSRHRSNSVKDMFRSKDAAAKNALQQEERVQQAIKKPFHDQCIAIGVQCRVMTAALQEATSKIDREKRS